MKLSQMLDFLKKIWLAKSGSYTWKGDAKDAPIEAYADEFMGVTKAQKKKDKAAKAHKGDKTSKKEQTSDHPWFTWRSAKIFWVIAIIIGVIFNYIALIGNGIGLWSILLLIGRVFFLRFIKQKRLAADELKRGKIIFATIGMMILSIMFITFWAV